MAKLVQKSGYIKSGKAGGYMRYIATREGVEKLAGNSAVILRTSIQIRPARRELHMYMQSEASTLRDWVSSLT